MTRELKIRIEDYEAIEAKLLKIGAKFDKEIKYRYLYFNQPEGKVLKITERDGQFFLSKLELKGQNFEVQEPRLLKDVGQVIAKLSKEFGVKKRLVNKRRFFKYKDHVISTNRIGGWQFLIIEGESPDISVVTDDLGIKSPNVITESFDNLPLPNP